MVSDSNQFVLNKGDEQRMFTSKSSVSVQKPFKYPFAVQIIAAIIITIVTSYITVLNASIPRKDAEQLIHESEMRTTKAIDRLDTKQDQIIDKLDDLRERMAIIGERVGAKDKK